MKKLLKYPLCFILGYISLLIISLPLGYIWELTLPYRLFDNVKIHSYDFSWGGPLQESCWDITGNLKSPLSNIWHPMISSETHYHYEEFLRAFPHFRHEDISCYRADIPGMMYSYALLHRPSNTIYICISEN